MDKIEVLLYNIIIPQGLGTRPALIRQVCLERNQVEEPKLRRVGMVIFLAS